MKTSACQTPDHQPLFHRRLEPIREGLAMWCKSPIFLLATATKNQAHKLRNEPSGLCRASTGRHKSQVTPYSHLSNPHNPSPVLVHRCVARGFLPRGLSDACPPSSVASCSLTQEGRHLTTLNI